MHSHLKLSVQVQLRSVVAVCISFANLMYIYLFVSHLFLMIYWHHISKSANIFGGL